MESTISNSSLINLACYIMHTFNVYYDYILISQASQIIYLIPLILNKNSIGTYKLAFNILNI